MSVHVKVHTRPSPNRSLCQTCANCVTVEAAASGRRHTRDETATCCSVGVSASNSRTACVTASEEPMKGCVICYT
eukprot:7389849-Prymnesium_polylepis.1